MSQNPEGKYYSGKWLFYCDVCNKKMLSSDAYKRWDGLYVCKEDWEPRHPSDFIRARKETSNQLPWSRPGAAGTSIAPNYADQYIVDIDGGQFPIAGYDSSGAEYWYDTQYPGYSPWPGAYVQGGIGSGSYY